MSLWQRFLNIFRSKANKVLDRAEDPREMLDYSYQRQLELLTTVELDEENGGLERRDA